MEFTAEEILDEHVCQWCAKKDCPIRNKIVDMGSCRNLEFDKSKKDRHNAWNAARQKVCLVHTLRCNPPHGFDNKKFREWVKHTYRGKKILV